MKSNIPTTTATSKLLCTTCNVNSNSNQHVSFTQNSYPNYKYCIKSYDHRLRNRFALFDYGPLENTYFINEEGDVLFQNWVKSDIDVQALRYGVQRPNLDDVLDNLYFCGRTESGLTDVFIYDEGWVIAFPLFHCRHQYLTKNLSYMRDNICRVECSKYRRYVRWTRVKDVGCACADCILEKRKDMSKDRIKELLNLYFEAEEEDTEGCQIASRFRICDIGKSAYPNLLDTNYYEHPGRWDLGLSFINHNLRRNLKYEIVHAKDGDTVKVIGTKGEYIRVKITKY
jgi:hypothetical protein